MGGRERRKEKEKERKEREKKEKRKKGNQEPEKFLCYITQHYITQRCISSQLVMDLAE